MSMRGATLSQVIDMARSLKLGARPLRLEMPALGRLSTPCILHWGMDHFVVLEKFNSGRATIVDPSIGRRVVNQAELNQKFTGVALELYPTEGFSRIRDRQALRFSDFFYGVKGLRSALLVLLFLSFAIQAFALLAPILTQVIIDDVISASDTPLLNTIAIAFLLFALINIAISAIRSFTVMQFGARLQFEWANRLFHHLVRLPLTFFEKRHLGDISSKFGSIEAVQNTVTSTIVETVIDGVMAVTTLMVMVVYAPSLATAPIVALVAYGFLRATFYGPQRFAAHQALIKGANERSHFYETLRGILAIKSFSGESTREMNWQNKAAESIQASIHSASISEWQTVAQRTMFAIENVVVLWLGAGMVIANDLTVGMLVAFLSYKSQFTTRAIALVDKALDFRMLDVHLERLSDIALTNKEVSLASEEAPMAVTSGEIKAHGLKFRYAPTESYVLDGVSVAINEGECVAIVAPSGFGKTTLLKILMGLFSPEEGVVEVDGQVITDRNVASYRKQVAAVMQEDCLLTGSLLDNIAFFDAEPDESRAKECAELAGILKDIESMPMRFASLVGDMGAALSGGQKQRVLLARALYRRPRILFLDEATSHVDIETEKKIHRTIAALNITRVMVTHRKESLEIANRVIRLGA